MTPKHHFKLDRTAVENHATTSLFAWAFKLLFNTDMVHLSLLVLGVFIAHLGCIAASPTVVLDRGTFQGATDGTTNKFFGIPFAKPP